jgi:hypothetical protein
MTRYETKRINKIRAALLSLIVSLSAGGIFYSGAASKFFGAGAQGRTATPIRRTRPARQRPTTTPAATRFQQFPHNKHSANCASCHKFPSANWRSVRKTDAFPDVTDYPRHESCLNCHRQQFFKGARPAICTVCHTGSTPQGAPRHPFANPRETFDQSPKGKSAVSDFQIYFPHDKHVDIVSRNDAVDGAMFVNARFKRAAQKSESCAVCHQTYQPQGSAPDEYVTKPPEKLGDAFWLKKGTFKTSPTSHATCFTCHSADSGIAPAPTDCAVCHKPDKALTKTDFDPKIAAPMKIDDKIMLLAWRRRDSSATFRHEFASHAELDCATCHNAAAMNTIDPLTKKVPVTSCNMCHITATADDGGILNFEADARQKDAKFQCAKCHLAFGKDPMPESHVKAIEAAGQ